VFGVRLAVTRDMSDWITKDWTCLEERFCETEGSLGLVVVVLAGVATRSKDGCESVDGPIGRSCQTIRNGYDVVVLATLVCIFSLFLVKCILSQVGT
jgi:hypothetical protein